MGQPDFLVQSSAYLLVIDCTTGGTPWTARRAVALTAALLPGISVRNYHLAEHVRACITPAGAIFLDLRHDAYSGIDAGQTNALGSAVEGWPEYSFAAKASPMETRALVASLCASGALVPRSAPGRPHSSPQHDEPTDELMAWRYMRPVKICFRDVLSFFRALLTAITVLRCRSMSAVAARAERLSTRDINACDLDRARELLTVYTYIRMFVFARRGRCLLDSLTLLEFLSAHGVRVRWIIGVRVRPFSAHSWLQHDHWVLNGTPAFVRGFHIILTT